MGTGLLAVEGSWGLGAPPPSACLGKDSRMVSAALPVLPPLSQPRPASTSRIPGAPPCFLAPGPLTGSVDSEWGVHGERVVPGAKGESSVHGRS